MADAARRARELFLDDSNTYGCAETTLVALQELFGLPEPGDSSAAMPLNGGIAYSGGTCGAITGAALAVGRLAGRRLTDHNEAKREARRLTQDLMAAFGAEYGSTACRDLVGYDLLAPGQHDAFIASGIWRDVCMRQIEFALTHATRLVAEAGWLPSAPGTAAHEPLLPPDGPAAWSPERARHQPTSE
jgi:C_GCAxxG_C_C family probable redox protein